MRRQAAVDGQSIDPWHLAAVLEGLRLRMDGALRIIDRGAIFEAARHALTLHQWIVAPDFDQEGEVQVAEKALAHPSAAGGPAALAAALRMHAWLQDGGTRPPIRAALIRYWTKHKLLRTPVPLTGPRALGAEAPFERGGLDSAFPARRWPPRRPTLGSCSWTSSAPGSPPAPPSPGGAAPRAPPPPSTSWPRRRWSRRRRLPPGWAWRSRTRSRCSTAWWTPAFAVEVTHRSKRRLFGLKAWRRCATRSRRPAGRNPGAGRGRPPASWRPRTPSPPPPLPRPPLTPIERQAFDYSELEHCMAQLDQAIRHTQHTLDALVGPRIESRPLSQAAPVCRRYLPSDDAPEPGHQDDRMEHYV